jgi:hypothetical protein
MLLVLVHTSLASATPDKMPSKCTPVQFGGCPCKHYYKVDACRMGVGVWRGSSGAKYLACCHVIALGGIFDGLLNLFGLKLDVCGTDRYRLIDKGW